METDERLVHSLLARRPIRRVALACIQCRLRKVKCDSTQPVCTRCRVDGKCCEYKKSRRGGRPRNPSAALTQSAEQTHSAYPTCSEPTAPIGSTVLMPLPSVSRASVTPDTTSASQNISLSSFTTPSSSRSCADGLDLSAAFGTVSAIIGCLPGVPECQIDLLIDQYYIYFHVAHPCVLPRSELLSKLATEPNILYPLLPVLLFIGAIFTPSVPQSPLANHALESINDTRHRGAHLDPFFVQSLTLYALAVYACNEPDRGRELLDEAIQIALDIGMHHAEFAAQNGHKDPVLEESWRRTWWQLYITDAHIAGSTHKFPTRTGTLQISTDLPCEEEDYEKAMIPPSPSLRSYDAREFSDIEFSSFAHLIGFTQGINRVLTTQHTDDPKQWRILCANADTMLSAWSSLLPRSKRRIMRDDGTVDEMLFKTNIVMQTYMVEIHRRLSALRYCPIEFISKCAAPPPPASASSLSFMRDEIGVHTAKCLLAIEKLSSLLTMPTRLITHTPFIICMITNMTIAQLSACAHLFQGSRLAEQREKIRLNMGVLKMLSEYWSAGAREYKNLGIIAREILSLQEEEITIPETSPVLPPGSLDFDFDSDWACDIPAGECEVPAINMGLSTEMAAY